MDYPLALLAGALLALSFPRFGHPVVAWIALVPLLIAILRQLVIWPESATPFYFEEDAVNADRIRKLVRESKLTLLFGGDQIAQGDPPSYYNSAFVLGTDGHTAGVYRKIHLVPFGEYVPLKRLLFFVQSGLQSARPPNTLAYNGNAIVYPAGNGRAFVPYATGGVGGLTMFERQALGVSEAATFLTGNVGGGAKYYFNSRWGLRGDYRFPAVRSKDDAPAFFGQETRYGHSVYGGIVLNVRP